MIGIKKKCGVFLLIVAFFHAFYLVPKANASVFEQIISRIVFRSVAPSVVMAMGSGTSLILGIPLAVGVGYLIYKSGAITAIKNWWNSSPAAPAYNGGAYLTAPNGIHHWHVYYSGGQWGRVCWTGATCGWLPGPPATGTEYGQYLAQAWGYSGWIAAYNAIYGQNPPNNQPPTSPTDYSTLLASTQPAYPSESVYGSPGVAAAVASGAVASYISQMSDDDASKFIAGLGGTAINTGTGAQVGAGPTPTDNSISTGESQTVGLLQSILNFMSNLVGIKTDTGVMITKLDNVAVANQSVATKMDNVVTGIGQQVTAIQSVSTKMDNVVTAIGVQTSAVQSQTGILDNVVIGINTQTAALDQVKTKVEQLDNAITSTTATSTSIETRINSLKTLAITKFPFSLAGGLSVAEIQGESTYAFASLPLTPTISIVIDPMAGPLQGLFVWIRQMLVWLLWVGVLFAILHRAMEM